MPRQKSYDPTRVLESAMQAFWARGYEATTMNDLVKLSGINRGSLYTAYPGKEALFMEALRHYDKIYRADHLERVALDYSPCDAIIAVFETASMRPTDPGIPWGCLLVNTALELSPHNSEVKQFVGQSLQAVEEFFFARLEAAKLAALISPEINSRTTAQALLSLFLGLRVLTRSGSPQSTIDSITSQARMMLE